MANRVKEDEKNERIIRGLLKLPANKRCINCNNLGPQYVCTNFWTFICTNCSGAHREFTHRVKSVSMAKFTSQEVCALQEGGNERAKAIYFKEWDPQRNSYPDSSNADRLRDIIKHVYVDRRFTGERNSDRPPRAKDDKEDYNENRRSELYRVGSRSPPYNENYPERRSFGGRSDDRNYRYSYGERSPGYDQSDHRRSPRYFEVVDDRRRDDRHGNRTPVQRFEDRRFAEPRKPDGDSPNHQRAIDGSSPPVIRPVRDILGDDAPPLRVGDPPKPTGTKAIDPPPQAQRTSSSSSIGSADGTSTQAKVVNTISLIDFSADPEPPVSAPPAQPVPAPPESVPAPQPQPVRLQTNSPSVNGGDWASFDAFNQQKAPQPANNANPLDSALAQLSLSEPPSTGNVSTFPASVGPIPKANDGLRLPMMHQPHSSLFDVSVGVPSNQGSSELTIQGSSISPSAVAGPATGVPSQMPTKPSQETNGVQAPSATESKSSGRKELPVDFFTSLYPSATAAVPGWQRGPQFGMGYVMQYPSGMTMPAYPQPAKAANPFDLGNEPAPILAHAFPSMPPLQGASPSMTGPQTLLRSSSFGVPAQQWVPPQQHPQQLYPSAAPLSQYMLQQVPNNMPQQVPNNILPTMQQGSSGPINVGGPFGNPMVDQHTATRYSQPNTPNSFSSVGGNPFG